MPLLDALIKLLKPSLQRRIIAGVSLPLTPAFFCAGGLKHPLRILKYLFHCTEALLHNSVEGRTDPNPRRSYATGTVTGQPS
jgi:hypothetical protein